MAWIPGADVLIRDVFDLAALARIRLDADHVLVQRAGAVHYKIRHQNVLGPCIGFTADGDAVPLEQPVVGNGDVGDVPDPGFDCDMVISVADIRVGDRNVVRAGRIDSVCIGRSSGSSNLYAPCGEKVSGPKHMELWGVS